MEEKRINDDVELYPTSDEPVEAENELTAKDKPTVEPTSAKNDKPKAVRVGEIPGFRGKNKKRFKMSDGTEQEVFYASDVHVLDEEVGQYDDIEDTLTEDEDGKHLVCGRHSFIAKFNNEENNDELFSIEQGKHKVTVLAKRNYNSKDKSRKPKVENLRANSKNGRKIISFSDIENNSIYEYAVEPGGVKENIIINGMNKSYSYPFILKCENVRATLDSKKKKISFIDVESDKEVFHIPAPFMVDNNNVTSKEVSYELSTEDNGDALLTIIADDKWMNTKERSFPVIIDPQIMVSGTSLLKTYSWDATSGFISSSTHKVGVAPEDSDANTYSYHRMYMEITYPAISLSSRIKRAMLTVRGTVNSAENNGVTSEDAFIGLYHVDGTFEDGSEEPTITGNLIDFDSLMDDGENIVSYKFDITEFIDCLNNGKSYNNKFVLKLIDETQTTNNNITILGANHGTDAPQLEITYEPNYAVNTSYRSHTHSIGRFGQAAIDLQYGNLAFDSTDFAWAGNRMPITTKHIYNSILHDKQYTKNSDVKLNVADFSTMNVGCGFKLNIMQSMCMVGSEYIYTDENGAETILTLQDNGTYENENRDMSYNSSDSILKIGDEQLLFSDERLVKIINENNNTQINYTSGRITSVVDGVGRAFEFVYSGNNLISIVAPDGSSIQYTYTENYLSGITYPDGTRAIIEYTLDKPTAVIIKDAADNNVYKIAYAFEGYRVISITEYGVENNEFVQGAKSEYSYSAASRRTLVTTTELDDTGENSNVIKTFYSFDDDGNIVSNYVHSEDIGNSGFTDTSNGIHPYAANGTNIIHTIPNLLYNHTFQNCSTEHWEVASDCAACTNMYITSLEDKFVKYAMAIEATDSSAKNNTVSQKTLSLAAGEYTLSAYVKVARQFDGNDSGVFIRVSTSDGTALTTSNKLTSPNSQYIRLIAPLKIDTDQSVGVEFVLDGAGLVYICAPQLENNPFANDYNMIQNGNLSMNTEYWTERSENCRIVAATGFDLRRFIQFTNNDAPGIRFCKQTIYPIYDRSVRETFTLSGWAKGTALFDHERNGSYSSTFRLKAVLHYSDGTTETHEANFSPSIDVWQYASIQFSKERFESVDKIDIFCEYNYNRGRAFFDDIQLIRNSIETDLTANDFVIEAEEEDADAVYEDVDTTTAADAEEVQDFTEVTDSFGNTLTETTFTDGEFGTIYRSFGYTENGNDLITETDARGNKTIYEVEANTSRNKEVTDRCGNKTAYEYDSSGRITKVISKNADGAEIANVSYSHDAFDNMTEIARGDGMKYTLKYNAFHNLESIGIDGKDESLIKYTYKNSNGRLKEIAYANGDKMTATYNSVGQLIDEKWFNIDDTLVSHYKYFYDSNGNIVRSIDISSEKEYNYIYSEGSLIQAITYNILLDGESVVSRTATDDIRYIYDSDGNITKKIITSADGKSFVYNFETNDNKTIVKFDTGKDKVNSHSKQDSFGRKIFDELQLGCGFISRQFEYVKGSATEEHTKTGKLKSSPTTQLVSRILLSDGRTIEYEYDAEERITKVVDSVDGTTEYTYDALGQLLTERLNGHIINSMTYDTYGNIISKNGQTYFYDSTWHDLLTGIEGESIEYDAQGNPTSYLGHTLTWEKGRQLKSFDDNTYTYNANGIRTSKTVNGIKHEYVLDGTKILKETWGDNTLIPLYDNEDSVCGIIYNDYAYYFLKNLQGDIIAITNNKGEVVASYTYDAWGVCTIVSDNTGIIARVNPYRYRGYYYDQEIGLYYLQSRYYDAFTSKFINSDDMGLHFATVASGSYSPWHYCYNDPVNFIDECGYASSSIKDSIKSYAKETWIAWIMNKFFSKVNNYGRLDLIPKGRWGLDVQLFLQIAATKGYKKHSKSSIETSFKGVSFKLAWDGKLDTTIGLTISGHKVSFMRGIDWKKSYFSIIISYITKDGKFEFTTGLYVSISHWLKLAIAITVVGICVILPTLAPALISAVSALSASPRALPGICATILNRLSYLPNK